MSKPPHRSLSRTRHLSREQHSSNKIQPSQNNNEPEVQIRGCDLKRHERTSVGITDLIHEEPIKEFVSSSDTKPLQKIQGLHDVEYFI